MDTDANVRPLRIGGNERLYADPSRLQGEDDMAAGLADRGLGSPGPPPPPVAVPSKPKPKPRGKKRKPPNPPPKPAAEIRRERQERLSTLMELLGVTVLTIGIALFSVRAALIVLGICILIPPTLAVMVDTVTALRSRRL